MSLDTADVADGGSIDDTPPHVRTPAAPVAGAAGMDSPQPTAGAAGANVSAPEGGVAAGAGGEIGTQAGAGATAPTPTVPVPPACQPSDEQCDNNDNDCDGKVDEGLIESCDDANLLGECKPGRTTCSAGVWSACEGSVKPKAEACDAARLDENCDGSRNEGCGCVDGDTQACGKDRGLCRPGTQSCMNGVGGRAWAPSIHRAKKPATKPARTRTATVSRTRTATASTASSRLVPEAVTPVSAVEASGPVETAPGASAAACALRATKSAMAWMTTVMA